MLFRDTHRAGDGKCDIRKAGIKSVHRLALSLLLPLSLSACGDFSLGGIGPTDTTAAGSSDVTMSSGKDQINTSSLAIEADKQTDTSRLEVGGPAGPTEKTESSDATSNQLVNDVAPNSSVNDVVSTNAVNSVNTIVDDMALMNDLPLIGADPSYGYATGPGFNIMGNIPSGSNLPSWFTSSYPEAANTGYWNYLLPWFVLFEGQGNSASNVRIQMRNLKLFILSRSTNQWTELVATQDIGGEYCPRGGDYDACSEGNSKRAEPSGGISIAPLADNDFYGWYGGLSEINGADIKAVFVTLQSRLIQANPNESDDREQARYLFDVGADYFPETGPSDFSLPGVGVSRAKLISGNWKAFNFMTFSDVGVQDPGGGISETQFRSNPPPIE